MQDFIEKKWGKISLVILLFISFIALSPFIQKGLPLTHDGIDHVARIANFYQGLMDGNLVPRWGANLNWGFGHPVLMFLYPLSSYSASFFHFLGFNFENSVKIVFIVFYIASGFSMFLWARKQFDIYVGLLASLLYILAPYRFIDMYVRGAIGEHVAFTFPPLILFFIYKLFYESKTSKSQYFNFMGISVASACLILAHNAISIMFFPLIFFYSIYLTLVSKKTKLLFLTLLGMTFGFVLSTFFLLPAFIEGKYTLRDIVTGDEYKTRFVEPLKLLYGNWNFGITGQFSVQLGIVHILGFIVSPFVYFENNYSKSKNIKRLIIIIVLFFFASIFLMLPQSNFLYEIFTTLKKFQFPWRFLTLSVFTISILAATSLYLFKNAKYKKAAVLIIAAILLFQSAKFISANGYFSKGDAFYKGIYKSTTDTGESSPIWSIRFMEKEANSKVEVIDGEASVEETFRNSTKHRYKINVKTQEARVKDNTVYFPGWKVFVSGNEVPTEFQDQLHRGLITFKVPQGNHNVEVSFQDTKLRTLSNIISIAGFIILILIFPLFVRKK